MTTLVFYLSFLSPNIQDVFGHGFQTHVDVDIKALDATFQFRKLTALQLHIRGVSDRLHVAT